LAQQVEQQSLQFIGGAAQLLVGQEAALYSFVALIRQLSEIAEAGGIPVRLQILGHASSEGTERLNETLSRQRAEQVQQALIQRGITLDQVEAIGTGTPRMTTPEEIEADRALNRSVTFRVVTGEE
jgi:outer membrane protein OmpA-like peptidoglycan-associated protein